MSVLIGLLLLTWHHILNLIIYNITIGPLSFNEMGSIFLDDIYVAHSRSGFDLFAPILAVLPAATMFCEDYNSGYLIMILSRSDRRKYLKETYLCSTICGGLAIFIPSILSSVFYIINGKTNTIENMKYGYSTVFDESVFADIQYMYGGGLLVGLLLVLSFVFGAIWSNVGLYISVLLPKRYIALASPFVIYFALHLIFYRIGTLLVLSPANMLMPAATFIPNKIFPFCYQVIMFAMVTILYNCAIKRRLQDV